MSEAPIYQEIRPSRSSASIVGIATAYEGYALGIEGGADRIDDAMDSTFRIPVDSYVGVAGSGRALAGATVGAITFGDIIVQGGNTNSETAAAVRDELLRSLRPAFVDMLEQSDAEGGL